MLSPILFNYFLDNFMKNIIKKYQGVPLQSGLQEVLEDLDYTGYNCLLSSNLNEMQAKLLLQSRGSTGRIENKQD